MFSNRKKKNLGIFFLEESFHSFHGR